LAICEPGSGQGKLLTPFNSQLKSAITWLASASVPLINW